MALKAALGHADIQTTENYLRALGADFALEAKHASPGDWLL